LQKRKDYQIERPAAKYPRLRLSSRRFAAALKSAEITFCRNVSAAGGASVALEFGKVKNALQKRKSCVGEMAAAAE
jgi:hypothetical protein